MVPARRKEITWLEEVSLPGREEAAGRDPAGTGGLAFLLAMWVVQPRKELLA
jgi:hypothetical protein